MLLFLVCRDPLEQVGAEEEGRAATWGVLGRDPCLLFGEAGPLDGGGSRHRGLRVATLKGIFGFEEVLGAGT